MSKNTDKPQDTISDPIAAEAVRRLGEARSRGARIGDDADYIVREIQEQNMDRERGKSAR